MPCCVLMSVTDDAGSLLKMLYYCVCLNDAGVVNVVEYDLAGFDVDCFDEIGNCVGCLLDVVEMHQFCKKYLLAGDR